MNQNKSIEIFVKGNDIENISENEIINKYTPASETNSNLINQVKSYKCLSQFLKIGYYLIITAWGFITFGTGK